LSHAASDAAVFAVGHVGVVTVGGARPRAFGEHHGQAAIDDLFGRAVPARALILRPFAALTEGAVRPAALAVGPSLGVAAGFGVGATRDRSDADSRAVLVGASDAERAGALER
jgi:hypothetical protein